MKKSLIVWGSVAVVVAAGIGFVFQQRLPDQLLVAGGFKAKTLCAGLFVEGIDQKKLEAEDSGFLSIFSVLKPSVDTARQSVTVSLFGTGLFAMTAVRVPGFGAVLVEGRTEAEVRALGPPPESSWKPSDRDSRPWPLGDVPGRAARVPALADAVDVAFAEPDPAHLKRTRAVVVLVNGVLEAERYAEGISADTKLLAWSMAKSFTNVLVGMAVRQGKLDIHTPAAVPEWPTGDPRHAITVDHLLRMDSGLKFFEEYNDTPISDVNLMLFREPDFGAYAASLPLAAPSGTVWNYSSGSTNIVSRILRSALGDRTYWDFPTRELFEPLGMHSAEFGTDATGTYAGSSYLYATARDYARFGQFLLQDGVWDGHRLLPEGWLKSSTTPTPTSARGEYGASFWLNAGTKDHPSDRDYPDMPTDLYWADGHNGQSIFVCPSLGLVAVRLGMSWDPDWGSAAFLTAIRKTLQPPR